MSLMSLGRNLIFCQDINSSSPPGKFSLGNSWKRAGWLTHTNPTTENKQIDLLFPFLPASVAVYQGKARMGGEKSSGEKCIAKFSYCVCTQIFPCRILIHHLKLSVASEERAFNSFWKQKACRLFSEKKNMHMIFCSVDKHIANAQGENLCGEITAETILSNRVLHLLN